MVLKWVTSGVKDSLTGQLPNEDPCAFLEGESDEALMQSLMPRLLDKRKDVEIEYKPFQGKQDLEDKFYHRIKNWLKPDSAFVVLVDQDAEDCKKLKARLCDKCKDIDPSKLIVRIACRELESWYFGDLAAVEEALGVKNLTATYSKKSKYREPDSIQKPSQELRKITKGLYQKISGSRAIAPLLSLENNKSSSFQAFTKAIQKLCRDTDQPQS